MAVMAEMEDLQVERAAKKAEAKVEERVVN